MRIFRIRAFRVENLVLGIAMLVFVPVFFFASEYAQVALGEKATQVGLYLLYFFIGFAIASQIGGRMLDRNGAKRPVVIGCSLAAVGFALWAGELTKLTFSSQRVGYVVLAGAGVGFMLTPASTDAVNRAASHSYGEATGITQTVRNYSASLGLAILGTILLSNLRSRVATSLISLGVPKASAAAEASGISESQGGSGGLASIPHFVRLDFAYATRTVFYVMAGIMALAAVVALIGLQRGVQEGPRESRAETDTEVRTSGAATYDMSSGTAHELGGAEAGG
jgi:MFS family permease